MGISVNREDAAMHVHAATSIDREELQEEFIQQPGMLAYYNARYADAVDAEMEADLELSRTEAKLREGLRMATAQATGGKKLTLDELESRVLMDPKWYEAKKAHNKTKANKERIKGIVSAIHAKSEMLISLGAHLRNETKNINISVDPRTK